MKVPPILSSSRSISKFLSSSSLYASSFSCWRRASSSRRFRSASWASSSALVGFFYFLVSFFVSFGGSTGLGSAYSWTALFFLSISLRVVGPSFLKKEWYSMLTSTSWLGDKFLTTGVIFNPHISKGGTNISNTTSLLILFFSTVEVEQNSSTWIDWKSIWFSKMDKSGLMVSQLKSMLI